MKWVTVAVFANPLEAHVLKTKLESEDMEVFLKDENIVAANWLYSNAVGGVKVQVLTTQARRARELIGEIPPEGVPLCPECGSTKVTQGRGRDWFAAFMTLLGLLPPPQSRPTRRCSDCGHDW